MTRGVKDATRTAIQALIVRRVLARGRRKGWDDAMVASVILASLAPARVRARVSGPCYYCGDELASTVDHIIPVVLGGTDEPWNLVSCCFACNIAKSDNWIPVYLRGRRPFPTRPVPEGGLAPRQLPRVADWQKPKEAA